MRNRTMVKHCVRRVMLVKFWFRALFGTCRCGSVGLLGISDSDHKMANLPPRPKSPPPTVDARERDRGRDRGEPMASRLRDERGERPLPSRGPPRPSDTYIPSFKGRRDGNSRHEYEDRDRDRYRDFEWRDRHHRRERSPPPLFRRRESPTRDRDRRPPYRTATRRYVLCSAHDFLFNLSI